MKNDCQEKSTAEQHFKKYLDECDADPEIWMTIAVNEIQDRNVIQQFLSLLDDDIDILSTAAKSIKTSKHDIWLVLDVVEIGLPDMKAVHLDSLIRLCEAQYEHTKNDGARGIFFNALEEKFSTDPGLCIGLLTELHPIFNEAVSSLYTTSIIALSESNSTTAFEHALNDVKSENKLLAANAVNLLGQLTALRRLEKKERITALKEIVTQLNEPSGEVKNAAILAIVKGAMHDVEFAKELSALLEKNNVEAICYLAVTMFQEGIEATTLNPNFDKWLESLVHVPVSAAGAIDKLDLLLYSIYKNGEHEKVINFLEKWIATQQKPSSKQKVLELLDSTFHQIAEDDLKLSEMLTKWLVSDEWSLVLAAEEILRYSRHEKSSPLRFCVDTVDNFESDELILLIRRTLGFSIDETQLISLILSLLDVKNAESKTYCYIEEVLIKEIGEDYPNGVLNSMKKLVEVRTEKPLLKMCERVISSINNYHVALTTLPQIKELSENPDHVYKITKERNKSMAESLKEARKGSIMDLIALTVLMKSGRAMFSFCDGEYREPTPLREYSHSITFPRRHVLDGVGDEIRRHFYRHSTKKTS